MMPSFLISNSLFIQRTQMDMRKKKNLSLDVEWREKESKTVIVIVETNIGCINGSIPLLA